MANQQASPTDAKRNAQPTITRDPTGPTKSLFKNPFEFEVMKFPSNMGNTDRNLHWVKFTPCIQQKSEYQVKKETRGGLEVMSFADTNRASGEGAGSRDLFSAAQGAGIGASLAVIGAAEAAFEAIQQSSVAEARKAFILGTGGATVGGAASGVIVSAIDLSRKTRRAAASICLYMPDTLATQMVTDYDQVSLTDALGKAGLVGQAGGSVIEGAVERLTGQTPSFGLGAGGTAAGGLAEAGGLVAEKTGNFGAGITDVLLFSAGLALNPQVELLFKNIQNREFLFDFRLVPRNQKEANEITEIIKKLRFFAAPEIPSNSSGRYFIPPSEFDIEFMVGQKRNPYLPRVSTCVLQGIDVNYSSAGQWTAFQDGMPVEISLQLRFKEVEILHKKLIDEGY
jgi:hypothetical protein